MVNNEPANICVAVSKLQPDNPPINGRPLSVILKVMAVINGISTHCVAIVAQSVMLMAVDSVGLPLGHEILTMMMVVSQTPAVSQT